MKKYAELEILEHLRSNICLSIDGGRVFYFVSLDDEGSLITDGMVNRHDHDVNVDIRYPADYLGLSEEEYDEMEDVDAFYAKENADDDAFMDIVKELTEEVNDLIITLAE